jgi:hypothetical protein
MLTLRRIEEEKISLPPSPAATTSQQQQPPSNWEPLSGTTGMPTLLQDVLVA